MAAGVEFCCGLAIYNDQVLMTFGYQDNAAFLLKVSLEYLKKFLEI